MSVCQRCQAASVESGITYCPRPRLLSCPSFYLHTPRKIPPSFTKGITMGSERLRRGLAVVPIQLAELLDTLDAPHQ